MKYWILKSKWKTLFSGMLAAVFFFSPGAQALEADGAKVGQPAPLFVLTDEKGDQMEMERLLDKPAVIYFTHNACFYCTQIIAYLKRAEEKFGREKIRIFGINVMAKDEKFVIAYQRELGFTFPMLAGNRADVLKAYKVAYVPILVFVDARKVTRKVVGHYIQETELHRNIREILGQFPSLENK